MEVFKVVPKLEALALATAYKAILDDLSHCYGLGPTGKRIYRQSPESEDIRDRVRNRLDQTLVGLVSDRFRMECVKSFDSDHQESEFTGVSVVVDTWLFLDSVLDDSIKELSISIGLPETEDSYHLIPVIANQSPELTKLSIGFSWMKERVYDGRESERKLETVFRSLASLSCLTHLDLNIFISQREALLVYGLVGEVCPLLSSLKVCCFETKDGDIFAGNDEFIVALVMGKSASIFHCDDRPSWCEFGALDRIDVPEEFRTQICSSLRELDQVFGYLSASAAAFALRNLTLLQKFKSQDNICKGIEILHRGQQGNSPFQGPLSLSSVHRVNVKSRKMLRAVGDLCPSLDEVQFCGHLDEEVEPDDFVSPEEIASLLSKWPKPARLELYEVACVYTQAILEVFGLDLKHLKIDCFVITGRKVVKVAHFALCPRLENLCILNFIMEEAEDVSSLDATTFLPHLKSFKSGGCLGSFSHLFEEKKSLVHLDVYCSHVRMKVKGRRPQNCHLSLKEDLHIESELSRIHSIWFQLETLAIRQCVALSMDKMKDLLPRLRRLKKVVLPQSIYLGNSLLFGIIKAELINRNQPVKITFNNYTKCVYLSTFSPSQ